MGGNEGERGEMGGNTLRWVKIEEIWRNLEKLVFFRFSPIFPHCSPFSPIFPPLVVPVGHPPSTTCQTKVVFGGGGGG